MALQNDIPSVRKGDWTRLKITIDKLRHIALGAGASPTFANLSLGTGELTTGSINRAAGTLTLEIAGTAEISISSTTVTLGGNLVIPDTGYIGSASDPNAIQIAASGEVTFTDVITGVLPTAGAHLATKEYVDLAIGASADFFLSDNDDAIIANYHILYETDTGEASSTLVTDPMVENDDQLMFSYITASGVPGVEFLRAGVYILHTHLSRGTGDKPTTFYWTLSKYTLGDVETVLLTSEESSTIPDSTISFITHATLAADTAILVTDRLVLKLYANVGAAGGNSEVTMHMEGTHDCHLTNQLPSSIWQNQGDVLDDLNATGVNTFTGDPVNDFLVGTAAGTLAWQYGATARTSMGVGTGDSPQFTGLTLSGTAAIEGASVTIGKASTTTGTLVLHDSGSANTITLTVPNALAGSLSFTLPPTDGANTNVLQTDGNGVLTWVAAGGAHTHDGDTLQLDGINSDGGAFPFSTAGDLTFQPATDGTTRYQFLDADGGVPILNIDTVNENVIIGASISLGVPKQKFFVVASDNAAGFVVAQPSSSITGRAFLISSAGEDYSRCIFYANSFIGFGPGSATRDTFIGRGGTNTIRVGSLYDGTGAGILTVNSALGVGITATAAIPLDVLSGVENIARFDSTSTTYSRIMVDGAAGCDTQICFQNNNSTKWSMGNDADTDAFTIRTGFGAFGTTDRIIITAAGAVDVINDLTAGTIQADDGFTGTGSYTNFTIVGGIITAAS